MNFLPKQARFIYLNNKVQLVSVAIFKETLLGMPNQGFPSVLYYRSPWDSHVWFYESPRANFKSPILYMLKIIYGP